MRAPDAGIDTPTLLATGPIVAVATPAGRGGIGVVRVSGPALSALVDGIVGHPVPARQATLAAFRDAAGGPIDRGIVLYFPGPASFTGEDVLELHGHGGPVVMHRLVRRCLELGARPAAPGEFSLRAFLNDKLDLAQAEAVADLIDASTETAARAAMRSLDGELSRRARSIADALVRLRVFVEATLDFPEEDVDFIRAADAGSQLGSIRRDVDRLLADARTGSVLREGIHVVLVGRPNVGKSSLLNRLAGEEVAIVTEVPGTTRDAIRQSIEIAGVPLHVIDTAGLRETEDVVERVGIERTRAAIARADVALVVVDAALGLADEDIGILSCLPGALPRIIVRNKIDLVGEGARAAADGTEVSVSAKTGAGMALLADALLLRIGYAPREEGVFLARERHLSAIRAAARHLEQGAEHLALQLPPLELVAEELRLAHEALSSITGKFTADDLLGEIFSRFCIGK